LEGGRLKPAAAGYAVLLVAALSLSVLALAPLSTHPAAYLPDNADALGFAWAIAWGAHQLPRDPLHVFDANAFFPAKASLALGEPMLGQALLALPVYQLTRNDALTFNLLLVATLVMCAAAMFLLAKQVTGDVAGSLLAAEIFAFTTANYDSAARIQIVSSQWTPLALFFLVRLLAGRRRIDALGLALAFAMQGLSCLYFVLFLATLLAVSAPAFFFAGLDQPRLAKLPLSELALAALLAGVLLLPAGLTQLLHFQSFASDGPPREGALPQTSYQHALPGNWWYGQSFGVANTNYDDRHFTGLLPPLLLALGLALAVPRLRRALGLTAPAGSQRWLLPFFVFGLLAFLFGCGRELPWGGPGPYNLLHAYVPGYAETRVPSRFAMFVRLSTALFAAFGFATVFSRARARAAKYACGALLALLLPLEHMSTPLPVWRVSSGAEIPAVYRWLAAQPAPTPYLEFPPYPLRFRRSESFWLHFSTYHWQPLLNGYNSRYPYHHNFVNELLLEDFPADRSLRVLRELGVRYVVFHPAKRGGPEVEAALERFEHRIAKRPQLELVATFDDAGRYPDPIGRVGGERVYRIVSPERPALRIDTKSWRRLPRQGWSCEGAPGECAAALDGDRRTAFSTLREQRPGDSVRVRFGGVRRIRGVSLLSGRMANDFPRDVRLFALAGGQWLPLAHDFDEVDFVRQILERPDSAAINLAFEAVDAEGLEVRLALAGPGFSAWRLPEIEVFE
jgi:hypothetical protein